MIVDENGERLFRHPGSGERLETPQDFQAALDWVEEKMYPFYRVRRNILQERAERFPTAAMPSARSRTQVQERVARCPRCGGRLESEEAACEPPLAPPQPLLLKKW